MAAEAAPMEALLNKIPDSTAWAHGKPAEGERASASEAQLNYGTMTSSSFADKAAAAANTWRDWSDPWALLLYTAAEVGQLLLTLLSMVWLVWKREKFCMACAGRTMWLACLCEYTKTYVRLFPLMALVIALVVASRSLLRRHLFYQMLKNGVLVRLERRHALQDPLFYFLIWCLLHVLAHFSMATSASVNSEEEKVMRALGVGQSPSETAVQTKFIEEVKVFAIYYLTPAIVFMCFLWTSYDTENTLLPLSKFMEGDPEDACERLSGTSIITEAEAYQAKELGLSFEGREGQPYQVGDLCLELVERSRWLAPADSVGGAGPSQEAGDQGQAGSRRSSMTNLFARTWWIAELMIDRELTDDESYKFRLVWYVYAIISLSLIAFASAIFLWLMRCNIHNLLSDSRVTDRMFCGLLAQAIHLIVTAHVGIGFVCSLWSPLREAAGRKAVEVGSSFRLRKGK